MYRKNKRKNGNSKAEKGSKFRGNRHSIVTKKNRKKRKFYQEKPENNEEVTKKVKIEQIEESSSESSEEEDPLKQLLCTFDPNVKNNLAVESDEDESENEENESNGREDENKKEENENSDQIDEAEDDELSEKELSDLEDVQNEPEDLNQSDPFVNHYCFDLSENFTDFLQNNGGKNIETMEWPQLGKMAVALPDFTEKSTELTKFTICEDKQWAPLGKKPTKINLNTINPTSVGIKSQIVDNIKSANMAAIENGDHIFSPFQNELFSIINNYQDLFYPERSFDNGEEIRFLYSLHSINHILKTRIKVLHHNAKLKNKSENPNDDFRDQGLVRPKVLIIVPFRDSALKIVKMFMDILVPTEKGQTINKSR